MVFDGLFCHTQAVADLAVRKAVADELEDPPLGRGEVGGGVGVVGSAPRHGPLVEKDPSRGHCLDVLRDLGTAHGFEEVRLRARGLGLGERLVVVEGRQHDALRVRNGLCEAADDVDSRAVWQAKVDERDVGVDKLPATDRFLDASGLRDDDEAVHAVDDFRDASAHHFVIVDDHDSDVIV